MTWRGSHVVALASGPSLTADDVEAVRRWRVGHDARRVITCNTTFRAAPWADVLVAQDAGWWQVYGAEAIAVCEGEMLSGSAVSRQHAGRVQRVNLPRSLACSLTGALAIAVAVHRGASRVILLGYDCAVRMIDGQRVAHWHGAHPRPLGDAGSVGRYDARLRAFATRLPSDVTVVNASRETACTAWPRVSIEEALA